MQTKLCECGCGNLAPISTFSRAKTGHVKGQPSRFIRGHNGGLNAGRKYASTFTGNEKTCTKCKELKVPSSFKLKSFGKYNSWCKACECKEQKQRYAADPNPARQRAYRQRDKIRAALKARIVRIRERGCLTCPERDPTCLDFHHVLDKDRNMGNYAQVSTFERELIKCVLVCANCHRKIHAGSITVTYEMCLPSDAGRVDTSAVV